MFVVSSVEQGATKISGMGFAHTEDNDAEEIRFEVYSSSIIYQVILLLSSNLLIL